MSFELTTYLLSEIASKITKGTTPSKKDGGFSDSGVNYIKAESVGFDGRIDRSKFAFISDDVHHKLKRSQLEVNDILFSMAGVHLGKVGLVEEQHVPANTNQALALIRPITSLVNPLYLLYFLQQREVVHFVNNATSQSAQPNINLKQIGDLEIRLPPLSVQNKVVDILSSLDRKQVINIELNLNLESIAQAIFKSWFVDFDPVRAKMKGEQPEGMDAATASLFPEKLVSETGLPEGWIQSEIGDEVTVVGGGTPSKKNDDFWVDGHIHWTSPKDLSGVQDKVLLDTASKLTEAGLKKVSSGLLPVDTVLLSSRAPVGYLALAKVPMAINQGYIAMKCEKQLPPEFVLQWCVHRMDEIKQRASGSTFAEISKKSFKPISVVVPTGEVLSAYQKLVKPLYDAITSNARQNEQLSSLRDTLLPKLLSGELPLSD